MYDTTARFRLSSGASAHPDAAPGLASVPTAGVESAAEAQLLNPRSPLLWFAGLAAAVFGLMAASTTVRVGGTRATVSLGDTGGKGGSDE